MSARKCLDCNRKIKGQRLRCPPCRAARHNALRRVTSPTRHCLDCKAPLPIHGRSPRCEEHRRLHLRRLDAVRQNRHYSRLVAEHRCTDCGCLIRTTIGSGKRCPICTSKHLGRLAKGREERAAAKAREAERRQIAEALSRPQLTIRQREDATRATERWPSLAPVNAHEICKPREGGPQLW